MSVDERAELKRLKKEQGELERKVSKLEPQKERPTRSHDQFLP